MAGKKYLESVKNIDTRKTYELEEATANVLATAKANFDEAIELNPNFAQAYHERGRAKLLNGDTVGSAEDMKKGLELNPKEIQGISGQYDNQPRQTDVLGL